MHMIPVSFAILLPALTALAQSEGDLRAAFEGMTITTKIDMPATSSGVDVYPTAGMPVDFRSLATKIKSAGTGVHQGEKIMVTKVVVKKDHIEFQLGGGGFGTFSDLLSSSSSTPGVSYEGKSRREKDLEDELKNTTDSAKRRQISAELDQLKRERNRDNNISSAISAQAQQTAQANQRAQRAASGSRFNIWYKEGMPSHATTPEGVMQALAKYVDFPEAVAPVPPALRSAAPSPRPETPVPAAAPENGGAKVLKKGMTVLQVEQLMGPAASAAQDKRGGLEINTREYSSDGLHISAQFVGGVLVDFKMTPE